ncbi:MAG: hypothetical protein HGB10_06470 [Coriobacteriia bacterium]|nr:hypothetical protein [Coriobacteriia bacterium]
MGVLSALRRATSAALVTFALIVVTLAVGCARVGNGMQADLSELLGARGIQVRVASAEAPISSRAGYVVLADDARTARQIVDALGLAPLDPARLPQPSIVSAAPGPISRMWGIAGRPASLRLSDGGQFEYLYVAVTEAGQVLVFAEYAYG